MNRYVVKDKNENIFLNYMQGHAYEAETSYYEFLTLTEAVSAINDMPKHFKKLTNPAVYRICFIEV